MYRLIYGLLITVALCCILSYVEKKGRFNNLKNYQKQSLIGLLFGISSICSTNLGWNIGGAVINVRDASPIIAGLIFGGPAGLIAGLIGSIHRFWFASGDYTRVACTIATFFAGVFVFCLRKYVFTEEKANIKYGLAIAICTEVLHMLMIFFTNMNDITGSFCFARIASMPMILANGLAVVFSIFLYNCFNSNKISEKNKQKNLDTSFQKWLLLCVSVAFVFTCIFSFFMQSNLGKSDAENELKLNLDDICVEIDNCKDISEVVEYLSHWRVGKNGFAFACDKSGLVLSGEYMGRYAVDKSIFENKALANKCFKINIFNTPSYAMYTEYKGAYYLAYIPTEEVMVYRNITMYVTVYIEILIFFMLFVLIYLLIKKLVVNNIKGINLKLGNITKGNLNEIIDINSHKEFSVLSDEINQTVATLKQYINDAEARIDKELELAKAIQHSALPSVFPPYPNRNEFEIFASMYTAKEVGGDFYDFYFVDDNKLAFIVADVSGKGIPAAMFMMLAKTTIKNLAESSMKVDEVFTNANRKLCEENDTGMFLTAWMGVIDLKDGLVKYVNAGHNPPLIRQGNNDFKYFKTKPNFVLAGIDGIKYRCGELKLNAGDTIVLYTDGIVEAIDENDRFYGEDRFLNCVNLCSENNVKYLCDFIKTDVDNFVKNAKQFDDITILAFTYKGEV